MCHAYNYICYKLSLCFIEFVSFGIAILLSARAVIPVSVIYRNAMNHNGEIAVRRVTPSLPITLMMTVKMLY